jgi:hypothetical protein
VLSRADIPFDRLDVATPSHSAAAGTLRATLNLVPMLGADVVSWQAASGAVERGSFEGLLGLVVQPRTGGAAAPRLVGLRADALVAIDPADDFAETELLAFDAPDATRRMQAASLGSVLTVSITCGEGVGEPERTLVVDGDAVYDYAPPLPVDDGVFTVYRSATDNTVGILPGFYGLRYAYVLEGGRLGPASDPVVVMLEPGGASGRYQVAFTLLGSSVPTADSLRARGIRGVAVLTTPPSENGLGATGQVYHHVLTIPLETESVQPQATLAIEAESLESQPVYEDDQLSHRVAGSGAVASYNDRLLLGDVELDYAVPGGEAWPWASTALQVRVGVELRVRSGTIVRIGEPFAGGAVLSPTTSTTLAYGDARATALLVYAADGDAWKLALRLPLAAARLHNAAYCLVPADTAVAAGAAAMPDVRTGRDYEPSRILVSELDRPRELHARRTQRAGDEPGDGVLSFAANTLPVSEGQFGQYPLWVLGRRSISAMPVGQGDVAFEGTGVMLQRGVVGRRAWTNVGRDVAACTVSGVVVLTPGEPATPITGPLVRETVAEDLLEALGPDTVLGYLEDDRRSRRELWLSAGVLTFVNALAAGRWTILDRARRGFVRLPVLTGGPRLLGFDPDGALFDEHAGEDPVSVMLLTSRLHLGAMGVRKRLYRLWLRQGRTPSAPLRWRLFERARRGDGTSRMLLLGEGYTNEHRSGYAMAAHVTEPHLLVSGTMLPGESIEGFGLEWETRLEHRAPATFAEDTEDVFWTPSTGFGGTIVQVDETDEYVEISTGGLFGMIREEVVVSFLGVDYPLESVVLTPVMLGRERIVIEDDETARVLVDEVL